MSGRDVSEVEVPFRRVPRWVEGFEARHGAVEVRAVGAGEGGPAEAMAADGPGGWELTAADGTRARIVPPAWVGNPAIGPRPQLPADLAALNPEYGVILLRRAGYAVAHLRGQEVLDAKVGTRHVHGRTAAGGWSQQRYARRRGNQADEIAGAAGEHAARILGPAAGVGLLVTGGDRPLLATALEALPARLTRLPTEHLGIGTPNRQVLAGVPDRVLAVRITLTSP